MNMLINPLLKVLVRAFPKSSSRDANIFLYGRYSLPFQSRGGGYVTWPSFVGEQGDGRRHVLLLLSFGLLPVASVLLRTFTRYA